MIKVGKGMFAKDPEEAAWFEASEETKAYIRQLENSIKKANAEMKLSPREVHAKFIKGAIEIIKVRTLEIKLKRQFLKFCDSKITPPKGKV